MNISEIKEKSINKIIRTASCIKDALPYTILKEQNGRHLYASYGDYFLIESYMKEKTDLTDMVRYKKEADKK